jgi:molybdate transport system substrate-binding protein
MRIVSSLALLLAFVAPAMCGEAQVAVAANFAEPAREIARAFAAKGAHTARLSFGASGAFYAQIGQGAPFDVFLSADEERPRKLAEEGHGVAASRFAYAMGRLALWSRDAGRVAGEATLREGRFDKIAVANPAGAPYGAAAHDAMKALGVADALKPKIVEGASIGQTFQFVETGNAELGFVALSQTIGKGGSTWLVPAHLHAPIRQDAILLKHGADNAAAAAFLDFLKSAQARAIVARYGYETAP